MKKKIKSLLILLLLIMPFKVQALTGSMKLQCDKTKVSPGATITCTLQGTASNGEVSAISSKIKTSTNLTLATVTTDSIWQGDGEGGNIDLYTDTNKTNTFNIATFTVTVSNSTTGSNESITIDSTKFYDESYQEVAVTTVLQNITIASTVNTLSSITLSEGTLSPSFNKDTLNYQATVKSDKVTLNATKTDANSTISGNTGELTLKYGANTFKINVTSQSGAVKTYTVVITRPDERDKDNQLASLLVDNNSITLVDGQTDYRYEVENNVEEVEISAVLNSSKASFVEGYEPGPITLREGENKVEIKVKAENEEEVTYTLTITRKSATTNTDKVSTTTDVSNPQTGMTAIYIVIVIVIISGILLFYFYKQYQKKKGKGKDTNEQ